MNQTPKALWNQVAAWWDESYQEGDIFHRTFIFPTIAEWTKIMKDKTILDIGCGNGALARLFTKKGAHVTATDFSEVFIEKAKQRSENLRIDYRVIDATDADQLAALVNLGKFDYVISSMVLHNMPTLTPLMNVLPKLLAPKGVFIFSSPHPCFNSGLVNIDELKQGMAKNQLVLSNRYIKPETFEISAKPGQPVKQMSFHRPLSEIFHALLSARLVMNGFEEPVAKAGDLPDDYLWAKLSDIPPVIMSRWKLE